MRRAAICLVALLILAACESGAPVDTATPMPTLGTSLTALAAVLRDGEADPDLRVEAARRLGTLGDPAAVRTLAEATLSDDDDVALAAIDALAGIGGEDAVAALVALTSIFPEDGDYGAEDRFVAAIEALGKVRGAVAIARLLELKVDDQLEGAAWLAVDAILEAFTVADVGAIGAALEDADEPVRLEAIDCLGSIGGPDAAELLIDQVASKDDEVRKAAVTALGEAGDRRATATLIKALSDEDVFHVASAALFKLYRDDATPLLKYLKAKSSVKVYYPLIRIGQKDTEDALVTALGKYGSKDMAVDYLNCGNAALEKAARRWASRHGYTVITLPGGSSVTWGG